ncbi:MAG: SDR family oxidoreductase [Rickettsiales bacterium]|nr:SDR family oxidoreductase [Rickettsiales bacterium]
MKRAAIITGGAKRVGAAMALYLAKHGYDIALHYSRSEKEAKALQKKIEKLGRRCELFQQDLADAAALLPLMKAIKKAMPHVSLLVNNASVFERGCLMDTDEALFERQIGVNLKAPFFLTQAFAKQFKQGCVVNILDTDISTVHFSHFAYLLSKKAFADFTRMAAYELGPSIRVHGICPGCMLPSDQNDSSYEDKIAKLIPLKSHPSLDELSEAVRWIAEQQHMTGQILFVDGGKHVL